MLPGRDSITTGLGFGSVLLERGAMETLSSSAELTVGATTCSRATGMSDARRPKLPTRAKPRATVNSPAWTTTFYSITSPTTPEYENLNILPRRRAGRNCKAALRQPSSAVQNNDLPGWHGSCKRTRLVFV